MIEPGLHNLPALEYHKDPCADPSLSSGVARILIEQSPLHAWFAHPRLNPEFEPEERETFDLGSAAHQFILEGVDSFVLIEAEDWRTKAAREARDEARLAGKTPLLKYRFVDIVNMANAVAQQLLAFAEKPKPLSSNGLTEHTLVWREENGVWCRARPDYLHADRDVIDDLKTTSASANPEAWSRGPIWAGPALQAAFYLRGLEMLFGSADRRFRFVVIENFKPHALSVVSLGPDAWVIAEKQRRYAVEAWGKCLRSNDWPAYPRRTCYADLPPWIEASWIHREESEIE